jgi:hypothetical protein
LQLGAGAALSQQMTVAFEEVEKHSGGKAA